MIMQLLAGANLVEVDFGLKEDRALFGGAQKRKCSLIVGNERVQHADEILCLPQSLLSLSRLAKLPSTS